MAVDTSPADSARSLLNGIDYSALIGGPLTAAISAQAMAAKSTWEFIQQVGLNTDKDGTRTAINVSFMYQRDGEMVKLIVPILTIVPIPMIVVDEISIDFTANINASASSTSEDSKSQDIGAELSAQGKIGWGPFSLTANVKASYSSKQSSKATQDSRYSVEYTQAVHVRARQADMPAGLATVLNILSSAATGGTAHGTLTVSPGFFSLTQLDKSIQQFVQVTAKNDNGLNVATEVKIAVGKDFKPCFKLSNTLTGGPLDWKDDGANVSTTATTDKRGTVGLTLALTGTALPTTSRPLMTFSMKAGDKADPVVEIVPISVTPALPPPETTLSFDLSGPLSIPKTPGTADVTVVGPPNAAVTVADKKSFAITSPFDLDANGRKSITVGRGTATAGDDVVFTATADGQTTTGTLKIELPDAGLLREMVEPLRLAPSAPRPEVAGLTAEHQVDRQSLLIGLGRSAGAAGPGQVRVAFDPGLLALGYDGRSVASGDTVQLDASDRARLDIGVLPGVEAAETQVVVEADRDSDVLRRVIPVQIGS